MLRRMTTGRADPPLLKRSHFVAILMIVVAFFLVGLGPVWREPFDYWKLGRSIIWSSVPIPFLVLASLWATRRLRLVSWLVSTILVTVTKFAVTATIMIVIWMASGPPPSEITESRPRLPELLPAPKAAPPPPIAPASTGRVSGRVLDGAGAPVAGALAWLDGVAPHDFALRTDVVVLTNDGHGTAPSEAAVQAGQPLVLRSLDGRVHTLAGELDGGGMVFNRPVLPSGPDQPIAFPNAVGTATVHCTVHPEERRSRLRVLPHPFFATTGPDGGFSFGGVPEGRITVRSTTADRQGETAVAITPGGDAAADVRLE